MGHPWTASRFLAETERSLRIEDAQTYSSVRAWSEGAPEETDPGRLGVRDTIGDAAGYVDAVMSLSRLTKRKLPSCDPGMVPVIETHGDHH